MLLDLDESFDDRNMFLVVLLGLLSAGDQLEEYLTRSGIRARADSEVNALPVERLDPSCDPVLYAVLGAMSFFRTVRTHAATAAARVDVGNAPSSLSARGAAAVVPAAAESSPGALRRLLV